MMNGTWIYDKATGKKVEGVWADGRKKGERPMTMDEYNRKDKPNPPEKRSSKDAKA